MTYLDRGISIVVVCGSLTGCMTNPWFHVETDSDGAGDTGTASGSGAPSSSGVPTSGDPSGTGSAGGTTAGAEAGESTTSGVPPATSTTGDPGGSTQVSDAESGPGTGESSGGGSSGGEGVCGDGVVDGGEECDDGMANGPHQACLGDCQKNVCGDGDQGPEEECDQGAMNDDFGACTTECHAATCGDGFKQPPEVCDNGANNGVPMIGACAPDCAGTILQKLEIRVTSTTYQGLLTVNADPGVLGADDRCQLAFQNFQGPWKAMIADGEARIASVNAWQGDGQLDWPLQAFTVYVNADPDPNIANKLIGVTGKARLLGKPADQSPNLLNAIGVDDGLVWTGLRKDWTSSQVDCKNWQSKAMEDKGTVGDATDKNDQYLEAEGPAVCLETRRLYCVQMPQ